MPESNPRIVEAFGKFMVQLADRDTKTKEIVTFDSYADAETALFVNEQAEAMEARADAYCNARGLTGKNAVNKRNVIIDFLTFEGAGNTPAE